MGSQNGQTSAAPGSVHTFTERRVTRVTPAIGTGAPDVPVPTYSLEDQWAQIAGELLKA
jgi:hypothetical protein